MGFRLVFDLVDGPWYSIDNLALNSCIYIALVSLFAVLCAFLAVALGGLGPVIGGFFCIADNRKQDAVTEVADKKEEEDETAVDPLLAVGPTLLASPASHEPGEDAKGAVLKVKGAAKSLDDQDILWLTDLLKKHSANDTHAWIALIQTATYLFGTLYLMHVYQTWWAVLLNAAVGVRSFIQFHDACHKSFFTSSSKNAMLAKVLETFVGQNAADWTKSHNHHHRHMGNFEVSDFSLTVWFSEKEYSELRPDLRFAYRLVRDPLVLPCMLSAFIFWIFPILKHPTNTLVTRGFFYAPLWAICGTRTALLAVLANWVAGIIGIQLFHLQHQCNTPYRVSANRHSKWDAGLLGSTHLLVPWPFSMMTNGIEFHHIHHASTQVPSYHLAACHREGELYYPRRSSTGGTSEGSLWTQAGVNQVGYRKAFLSLFHTLFAGDTKHSHDSDVAGPLPRFRSFDVYRWLGLEDDEL